MSKSKQFAVLLVVVALIGGAVAIIVGTAKPDVLLPVPGETASTSITDEPEEIFVDEDAVVIPDVTPPDIMSIIMVDEVREGKGALERCHDMGGALTLDMICHGVDY